MDNLFLVIDGVEIDGIEEDDYTAYEEELGVTDRMISGRLVEELRATVWVVEVNYREIDSETLEKLTKAIKATRKHQLFFLPSSGGEELKTGFFHLSTLPQPTLTRWLPGTKPKWSGYTLRFEEIDGHD